MDNTTRDDMIKQLAQIKPRYVHSYENFKPGDPVLYSGPFYDSKEIEYALRALLTEKWLSAGENVERFQRGFAKRFNVKHAHMVNSGSSANLVMIAALKKRFGWKDGDEIIVSPVGFPTTIAPIVQNGLKPVFVDIEWDTLNFDLDKVYQAVTGATVGIFVSPVLGNAPDMDALAEIASTTGVKLIGDNCDSLGSRWDGVYLSDYYVAWSSSFYPAHHISTGEGGMVCTNDEEIITHARSFSWWGKACYCVGSANLLACGTCGKRFDKWLPDYDGIVDHRYTFENMGYNLKPIDIQGAFGLAQLEKLDEIEHKRRKAFTEISEAVNDTLEFAKFNVRVADKLPASAPVWFGVPIICPTQSVKESIVAHLETNKIQTRSYFAGNILLHPGYKHLDDAKKYPNANKALSHVFFLGVNPAFNELVFHYIKAVFSTWKPEITI